MTTKLTNSLRKSISEEQKTITKAPTRRRTTVAKKTDAATTIDISNEIVAPVVNKIIPTANTTPESQPTTSADADTSKLLQLTNLTTEKFHTINQDIISYLQNISNIKNIYNLSNLNVELIKKLTAHQQELFDESVKILGHKK